MFVIGLSTRSMSTVHDHGGEDGLGHELVAAHRLALELPDIAAMLLARDVNVQAIAWQDRAPEARVVDAHEIDELAFRPGPQRLHNQHRCRLRHGFDDEHARHDRTLGKVAFEIALVDRHVLDADGALAGDHIHHTIDQQERVTVWDHLHDPLD